FDSIARTGRDLARKFGKKVRIQISGENTELDRVILDGIRDPLAHVIRNVIDHGIEMPRDRLKAGKKEKGVVELAAYQDGVAVVIRVADDGAGVNTEKLKKNVIEKGLISEEEVAKMSHKELIDLVFIPGLSTRAQATETSGRGVGMDVVRRNVEALKGEAHIDSKIGKGTIIELRVPLTLLVSRVLLTKVGDSIFAFATESLDSTESMYVQDYTEYAGMTVFKVRERHVPIISLKKLLDLPEEEDRNPQRRLVVVRHKEDLLALEIDEFVGERSVVIKPLGWPLINVPAISGAVLLGSGEMALTLHVPGLIERFYQGAPKGQTKRLISRGREKRKIILVVDDSKIYRNMARNSLESMGYEVHMATDGEDGWEQLNQNIPDLVLTDYEMPRLNGLQLTQRIKESEHYKHVPVIIISTHSTDEDKERGFQVGANDYLSKTEWNDDILNQAILRQIY
ncbi:MAG: response regulator, partial [Planctomycetota bacterium]|nr:response regulator [Planctomycetota bacterium]